MKKIVKWCDVQQAICPKPTCKGYMVLYHTKGDYLQCQSCEYTLFIKIEISDEEG